MCEDCGAGCNGTRANRRQHALEVRTFWRPRAALGSALAVNTVNEVRPRCMEDVGTFRAVSLCYRSHHQAGSQKCVDDVYFTPYSIRVKGAQNVFKHGSTHAWHCGATHGDR